MSSPPKILITAPGGNIGSVLVPLLAQKEVQLVLPTSNAARLATTVTSAANISIEEGSIKDPKWVEQIIRKHSINTVFLCLTSADELIVALNFFDAAQRAGSVKHLVYVSACGDFVSETGLQNLMHQQSAMHVVVKATLEQKLKYGAFPWTTTVLGPTLFFTNDLRSKHSMLTRNFFADPLGNAGVSHISIPDIAIAACNTLLHPDRWAGKKIMLGSLRRYTGAETAALWSEALGREIRVEDEPARWEEAMLQLKPKVSDVDAAWARDLRLMCEAFGEYGFGMTEEEHELQVELLGKQPDDYAQWVKETGAQWK